jgi:hypothetical protein
MLYANYEEFTDHDAWLIEQYYDPSYPTLDDHRRPVPAALIADVDRAYFRLAQDNTIAAWFEAGGFDISKPTIPKEEFEKRLAGYCVDPAASKSIVSDAKVIERFVSDYIKDNSATASLRGIREQWKTLHGAHRRNELDEEYRKQANNKEILLKRGRRAKCAKT